MDQIVHLQFEYFDRKFLDQKCFAVTALGGYVFKRAAYICCRIENLIDFRVPVTYLFLSISTDIHSLVKMEAIVCSQVKDILGIYFYYRIFIYYKCFSYSNCKHFCFNSVFHLLTVFHYLQ